MPIAVIETEAGSKIFVDRNGHEVKDHGYDLENDPRGHIRNKRIKKRTLI